MAFYNAYNFLKRTLYDYRGIDGTGTASSPATGSNQVSYVIRKLADGNCWMTDNLKLTLSTSHSYEVATNSGETTTWTPNSGSGNASNTAINANTKANVNGGNWYYPWYAATAGSGTSSSSGSDTIRSICPKGWRLPANYTYNTEKSYSSLTQAYFGFVSGNGTTENATKWMTLPLSFTVHGHYASGGLVAGTNGYYWSSSPASSSQSYALEFHGTKVQPQNPFGTRTYSYPIRCVAI